MRVFRFLGVTLRFHKLHEIVLYTLVKHNMNPEYIRFTWYQQRRIWTSKRIFSANIYSMYIYRGSRRTLYSAYSIVSRFLMDKDLFVLTLSTNKYIYNYNEWKPNKDGKRINLYLFYILLFEFMGASEQLRSFDSKGSKKNFILSNLIYGSIWLFH